MIQRVNFLQVNQYIYPKKSRRLSTFLYAFFLSSLTPKILKCPILLDFGSAERIGTLLDKIILETKKRR